MVKRILLLGLLSKVAASSFQMTGFVSSVSQSVKLYAVLTPKKLLFFSPSIQKSVRKAKFAQSMCTAASQSDTALQTLRTQKLKEAEDSFEGSLIPSSLEHIEQDGEHKEIATRLKDLGKEKMSLEERKKRWRALDTLGFPNFKQFIAGNSITLTKKELNILQINVGLYCNQACNHCHVESSPKRTEMMDQHVAERCMELLARSPTIKTLDLTGGAPELNKSFRYFVTEGYRLGKEVIDRCNLTVLSEPGQEDLAQFLADHKVRVVASLPCYGPKNVDMQRGQGVFARSIRGLILLNELGYGQEGSGLILDLVYNPLGPTLPPKQPSLEADYKRQLAADFGIQFNQLFTITNMPIKRFADRLARAGDLESYMSLLVSSFNPAACAGLMCRDLVSVDYRGHVFDCDFNQQLDIPAGGSGGKTVFDLETLEDLCGADVATDAHCFGCTAGSGSSCQGATA